MKNHKKESPYLTYGLNYSKYLCDSMKCGFALRLLVCNLSVIL